ncbi:transposase [Streptomyces bangladeshensis]|uniref:transposase n=1 Tax=Streptomyces bangladeshensis TaxID=295352 RepID=UPI003D1569F8
MSVDSTVLRAHQHAAGPEKGARSAGTRTLARWPDQQDPPGLRRPGASLAFTVTGGNTNDCTRFTAVMGAIWVPRLGPGRPRARPDHVVGDKGYSSTAIRAWLGRRGVGHTIRNGPARSVTGSGAVIAVGVRRPSSSTSISGATWSNAASTA